MGNYSSNYMYLYLHLLEIYDSVIAELFVEPAHDYRITFLLNNSTIYKMFLQHAII